MWPTRRRTRRRSGGRGPRGGQGGGAFPQLRLVALAESGTHAISDAALGPYTSSEQDAGRRAARAGFGGDAVPGRPRLLQLRALPEGPRDRGAAALAGEGAMSLPREQSCADGSYLTHIYKRSNHGRDRQARRPGARRRVPARGPRAAASRSSATGSDHDLLDPDKRRPPRSSPRSTRSAGRSRATLDELKTHQRGPRVVLRSKHPDGVYQEAYGYLCTHYAIRRADARRRAARRP